MPIPKRVSNRIKSGVHKFSKILEAVRDADRSEQDTVTIVVDMLAEIFGFDKYVEITGEYVIRGTFCDLAVKIDGTVQYLIEVKAAGKTLKETHLRQAINYASKSGIDWVVLTNGVEWQCHRVYFEKPIRHEQLFSLNFLDMDSDQYDLVYALCREGVTKSMMAEYYQQRRAMDRYCLAALVTSDKALKLFRRELRRISPGIRIDKDEIKESLASEVLKRDLFKGDGLWEATKRMKRANAKRLRALSQRRTKTLERKSMVVAK